MTEIKVAIEYERGLHTLDGFIANRAPEFLNHPLNQINEDFVKEATDHQNELNSQPHSSLDELCLNLLNAEKTSRKICQDLGVINIPISENGAGTATINPNPDITARSYAYDIIFGPGTVNRLTKISAMHIHVDQYKNRIVDQYNLMLALLPTIALTSTSPISHEGLNSESCHRYKLFADPEEGVFSKIPEKIDYINSINDLNKRDEERYKTWKYTFDTECWRNPDLPTDYNFRKFFKVENTGYAPIRKRPDIGDGTLELRIYDSAPIDVEIGVTGLVLGIIKRALENDISVYIAKDTKDYLYQFSEEGIILPNKKTLEYYTTLATKYGLEHDEIKQYNHALEKFARNGLRKSEQHYLDPLRTMINNGKNIASQILDHLGHKLIYTPKDAAKANLFVWDLQQQGIQSLQKKVSYHQ